MDPFDSEAFLADPATYNAIADWEDLSYLDDIADVLHQKGICKTEKSKEEFKRAFMKSNLRMKLEVQDAITPFGRQNEEYEHQWLTTNRFALLKQKYNKSKIDDETFARALLGIGQEKFADLLDKANEPNKRADNIEVDWQELAHLWSQSHPHDLPMREEDAEYLFLYLYPSYSSIPKVQNCIMKLSKYEADVIIYRYIIQAIENTWVQFKHDSTINRKEGPWSSGRPRILQKHQDTSAIGQTNRPNQNKTALQPHITTQIPDPHDESVDSQSSTPISAVFSVDEESSLENTAATSPSNTSDHRRMSPSQASEQDKKYKQDARAIRAKDNHDIESGTRVTKQAHCGPLSVTAIDALKPLSATDEVEHRKAKTGIPDQEQTSKSSSKKGRKHTGLISTHFNDPINSTSKTPATKSSPVKKRRTPAGASCVRFPPISDPNFGLAQERYAHEPFKLIIAVIFLNKTRGEVAMPIFRKLVEKYPTASALAEADKCDIVEHIRCLGLQNQRAEKVQRCARQWVASPPIMGKRYRSLNYPRKGDGKDIGVTEIVADERDDERLGAWEIAYLAGVGDYALDSWRIFCRDQLRGLAEGYRGEATEEGFEPEWQRVVPKDKELRAYLRWMWLKEGWEWNPLNGEKSKATKELIEQAEVGGIVWEDRENDTAATVEEPIRSVNIPEKEEKKSEEKSRKSKRSRSEQCGEAKNLPSRKSARLNQEVKPEEAGGGEEQSQQTDEKTNHIPDVAEEGQKPRPEISRKQKGKGRKKQ